MPVASGALGRYSTVGPFSWWRVMVKFDQSFFVAAGLRVCTRLAHHEGPCIAGVRAFCCVSVGCIFPSCRAMCVRELGIHGCLAAKTERTSKPGAILPGLRGRWLGHTGCIVRSTAHGRDGFLRSPENHLDFVVVCSWGGDCVMSLTTENFLGSCVADNGDSGQTTYLDWRLVEGCCLESVQCQTRGTARDKWCR